MTNTLKPISMGHLVWPIIVENLLRTSLTTVDVFMLSAYSLDAVAAVGLAQQFSFFLILTFNVVAVGATVLISQNLGAGKHEDASLLAIGSLMMVTVLGIVMSVLMVTLAGPILNGYSLEADVHRYAWEFMTIYGAGAVFVAINMIQGTILRAHGHSKDPMYVNIVALIINVIGNALFIYGPQIGPIQFPVLGVVGVALSTMVSQVLACILMQWRIYKRHDAPIPYKRAFSVPVKLYKQILAVGVPSAGENLSFNIGQIFIMRILSDFGTPAMTAYNLTFTLLRFVFMPTFSIGSAVQIKVGHLVGAGDQDEAKRLVFKYFGIGFALSLGLVLIANLVQAPLFTIFTNDAHVLGLIGIAMVASIALEPGRVFNLIYISGMKGAGDVRFPVYMGMIFMWGIEVGIGYVLAKVLGLGLLGIWIAMASDEWIRGLIMYFRWRSDRWKNRAFVQKEPAAQVEAG